MPHVFATATFETDRLLLRNVQMGDELLLFPAIDAELTKYWIGWEPPISLDEMREIVVRDIALGEAGGKLSLIAYEKQGGAFVGCVGIGPDPRPQAAFEFDVWVCHTRQRRGYAAEMVRGLIAWLRGHTELPGIAYSYTEGNEPSRRLIEKLRKEMSISEPWIEHEEKRGEPALTFNYFVPLD